MKKYTQSQVKNARLARYFQNTAGMSTRAMLKSIDSASMRNSPITRESVKIAEDAWGTSILYLQGKSTRQRNAVVDLNTEVITIIPPEILANHAEVIIGMDIIFVNGIPFLTTVSRVIRFGSSTEMPIATMDNVVIALKVVYAKYKVREFTIVAGSADNGFAALEKNQTS